jgi:DNA-binding transcriptional LysR family regulator
MTPSLRHLQIFRLFSRVMSVTETARMLRIAQPSVSQALKELEGQLGIELIVRGQGQLRLTEDAHLLLKDMDDVLEHMQALRERAARLRGDHESSISIATVHPLTASILPAALRRLRTKAPDARMRIEAYSSREVVQRVIDRTADIGFTFLPVDQPDMIVRPLLRTAMVCLLPAGHRLAAASEVTPPDLAGETIITLGTQVRQEFDVRLAFDDPENDARFLTTNHSIVSIDLVRQQIGVALVLPFTLSQPHLEDLTFRPFRPEINRVLAAVYLRRGMSPLTKSLLAEVREEVRAFGQRMSALGIKATAP